MGVRSPDAAVGAGGASTLLGRDAEMAALRGLLDRAGSGTPAAAVIQGEAGIGKTALLDTLVAVAAGAGWRCLAVRGIEAESVLTFAGLLAIAQPLRGYAQAVPPAQAAALDAALGWRAGDGGDRFLIGAATLSLLAAAAVDRPTLVVVDDVQWVDRESAEALLFAARRLGHDRVAVVATYRVGLPLPTSLDGLDVVDVAGLPTQRGVEGGGLRRRYGRRIPAQRLRDREQPGERQHRLRLDTTHGQAAPALTSRDRGERVEQRRLPDARLALDHGGRGSARSSAIQHAAQRGHLRVPTEQRAGTARTDGTHRRRHPHDPEL